MMELIRGFDQVGLGSVKWMDVVAVLLIEKVIRMVDDDKDGKISKKEINAIVDLLTSVDKILTEGDILKKIRRFVEMRGVTRASSLCSYSSDSSDPDSVGLGVNIWSILLKLCSWAC